MTTLTFTVTFHQPFLVQSGESRWGLDSVGRLGVPVPASELKGAMRAAATHVLRLGPVVEAVFGSARPVGDTSGGSTWGWSDLGPESAFVRWSRTKNRIDRESGTVIPEALAFEEEIWQRTGQTATFSIDRHRPLLPSDDERHRAVLTAAAHAVTALGHGRNRGMGAVTIRPAISTEWSQPLGTLLANRNEAS